MNQLQTETRGRLRWLKSVECDDDAGVTIRTARTQLPTGLIVERVDGADASIVFVTDLDGCEVTLSVEQSVELGAALDELPAPDQAASDPVHFGSPLRGLPVARRLHVLRRREVIEVPVLDKGRQLRWCGGARGAHTALGGQPSQPVPTV